MSYQKETDALTGQGSHTIPIGSPALLTEPQTLPEALSMLKRLRAENARLRVAAAHAPGDSPLAEPQGRDYSIAAYFDKPLTEILKERLPWTVALLLLESVSALVLTSFNDMIERHLVLALFSPMLVGTAILVHMQAGRPGSTRPH